MSYSTDKPISMNSETNITFHFNTEGIEVTDKQDNLKLKEELMSIEEPETLQFDDKMQFEVTESIKLEDTAIAVDESAQQYTSDEPAYEKSGKAENVMESAVLSQESLIQQTRGEIVTVGHDSLINGSQQAIPITETFPNINVKLGDKGAALGHYRVGSMKDAELKDLVNRELSKILNEEQEQSKHVQPFLLDVKSGSIIEDEEIKNALILNDDQTDHEYAKYYADCYALSTLADTALNQLPPPNGSENIVILKSTEPVEDVQEEQPWCDVGIFKGTSCTVIKFYPTTVTNEHENITLDNLINYSNKLITFLQPGLSYRFRIAAINSCGRGEWSDPVLYKTCCLDLPFAPYSIKIKKVTDGAQFTWEIPLTLSGKILEYTICMALKEPIGGKENHPLIANYYFARVYSGTNNAALVYNSVLSAALIDRTQSPAIIFRVAARNEKGYGPATQIRWLQHN